MRAIIVIGITLFYGLLFAYGFRHLPDPLNADLPPRMSAFFGFCSAVAWGLSVIGNPAWNGWFNFLAAGLAALALGYATPPGIFH